VLPAARAPVRGRAGVSGRSARILVVEDNDTLRRGIAVALRESFSCVEEARAGDEAVDRLVGSEGEPYDVVVTDLRLPGVDGVGVLDAARRRDPRTVVLLMTAYGSIETAVSAMKAGAFDFVQKPFDLEQLEVRVARAVEQRRLLDEVSELRAERAARTVPERIVGTSAALREALDLAGRVAETRSTVLVTGDTGTGKELIAGWVHRHSPRAQGPFVKVNCAALPENLLESELFGHERGAFTGAEQQRVGRFEQAHRGTLLLDEVGDMSPTVQAKVLRVLQDGEFHRVGGTRSLKSDVRIVAATNQDLEARVAERRFREDLFFRLNVIRIHLPPLRERTEDLVELAEHFLHRFAIELGRDVRGFTDEALARIRAHPWPGNVRELRNAIERSVLLAESRWIGAEELSLAPPVTGTATRGRPGPSFGTLTLRDVERELVLEALRRSDFVQKEAARLLGVSRRKLNYMIARMGITHARWRRNRSESGGVRSDAARAAGSERG